MPSPPINQDPADKVDYFIDWLGTPHGLAEDETIVSSTWTPFTARWLPSTELVSHDELNDFTNTTTTGWASFDETAKAGRLYYFTNHIVTDQGRELSWSIAIKCKEL